MDDARTPDEVAEALAAALADELPAPVRIEGIDRLTGGATRETWAFDALDANGERHALILGLERFVTTALMDEGALNGLCQSCQTLLPTDCKDWIPDALPGLAVK